MMLGSDGEEPVMTAHSTMAAAPLHIRLGNGRARACHARIRHVRRPAPDRRGAAGDEIIGSGGGGAVGHRDAAWEVRHGAGDVLRGQRVGRGARVHVCVRDEAILVLEHGAVLDHPRAIRARLHRARKHAAVPPVEEVAVQPVASRVAVREHEPPAVVQRVEWRHVEPHLKEDGHEVVWVRGRALAAIDAIRVRHVGLVIGRVEVHTIPAGREEHLCSETVRAIGICESWRIRLTRAVEVDANNIHFVSYQLATRRKEEADQFQEMAFDSGVPVLLRAYGFPVNIRSPSGKASTVSLGALRWR